MTDLLLTFDAGVPPNAVVAGANGVETIVEGTQMYEAGYHDTGIRAGGAANTTNTRYKIDLGLTGNHFGSIYLRNKTAHGSGTASVNFFYLVDTTNTNMARFRVGPSNALSIIAPEPTVVRTGAAGDIPVNSDFRFDWNVAGTVLTWKVFYNPEAAAASTPDRTGTVTVAGTADKIILGAQSSSAVIKDWSADTLRVTNTGSWFEPYSDAPPADSGLTLWNGTAEVPVTATLWNGTAEVPVTATFWDGLTEA